jgi:hypothetical protein
VQKKIISHCLFIFLVLYHPLIQARVESQSPLGHCITQQKNIYLQDNVEQIIMACGEPTKKMSSEDIQYTPKKLTRWLYYFQLDNKTNTPQNPTHLSVTLDIEFFNQKVDHVVISGADQATAVLTHLIEKNSDENQVKALLGEPMQTIHAIKNKKIKTTTITGLLYVNKNSGQQQLLRFKEGKLSHSEIRPLPEAITSIDT